MLPDFLRPSHRCHALGHPTGGSRASKDYDEGQYFFESHHNNAYIFAKNFQQRYLLSFLKRELGWI